MRNIQQNKENKKGFSSVKAGVIGVAVTAVAGAAAVVLSDKKRRKKVGKALNQLGETGREWAMKAQTTINKVENKLNQVNKGGSKGTRKKVTTKT